MAAKFYAVRKGKKPGIYMSWDICKQQTDGFPGAEFKSFPTREAAEEYIGQKQQTVEKEPENYAFVDGSYNIATKVYGYGGFLMADGKKEVLQGSGSEEEMVSMRNVAGEVLGSMAAIEKAVELGLAELTIYYDYMGIEMWATKGWKRNNALTQQYAAFYDSIKDRVRVHFHKVAAHTGDTYNEMADALAKQGAGI